MKNRKFSRAVALFYIMACLLYGIFGQATEAQAAYDPAYTASHPYAIYVNRAANCVTVYGLDSTGEYTVPVKAFACSVGRNADDTPLGTFMTSNYYTWRKLYGNTYGRYAAFVV